MSKRGRDDFRRAGELAQIAESISARALEVTTPMVTESEAGEPEYIGSAIGLRIGPYRFHATAAHVAARRHQRPLFAFGKDGVVPIQGEVTRVAPQHATATDHIDLSVLMLPEPAIELWPESSFAEWDELDHAWPLPERNSFLITGFPVASNRKPLQEGVLTARAYRFTALEALPASYEALGYDRQLNVVLGFDKKRMVGPDGMLTAPDPYGLSGSGAWRVGRHLREPDHAPLLSAILIEWHSKSREKHLLGTRIRVLLDAIAQRYPNVAAEMARAAASTRHSRPHRTTLGD